MHRILASIVTLLFVGAWSAAAAAEPLVDAAWLRDNAAREGVVVLDVRNELGGATAADYEAGHVPGAVYSNYLAAGWRTERDGVPGMLPPVADLERLIGGLGIDNATHVVIVAGGTGPLDMGSATRVYWTFKVLGHDAVSILDGGYRAYAADPANPVETGRNIPEPAEFTADFRPELLAGRAEVVAALEAGATLVDNRPAEQYMGKTKHPAAARPGTIPGARSVPEGALVDPDGTFVAGERLAVLLEAAGVGAGQEDITFCNTGHWASLGWFALSELAGRKQTRLYDGSMVDWSRQQDLPMQ